MADNTYLMVDKLKYPTIANRCILWTSTHKPAIWFGTDVSPSAILLPLYTTTMSSTQL